MTRRLPDHIELALYRIAQEALTNARRHAGPDASADVRLRYDRETVELEITNTGRVASMIRPGLGLVGMRERAAEVHRRRLRAPGRLDHPPRPARAPRGRVAGA